MSSRWSAVSLALVLASLSYGGCVVKKQEAPPPAPPPPAVVTPPPPVACGPIGIWNLDGPNGGKDQVEVVQGDTPDTFIVKHKNISNMPGVGTASGSEFKVDMSKSTLGLYSCKMNDDCKTMSCNFAGAPATMSKP
jgi:hypothetical protein